MIDKKTKFNAEDFISTAPMEDEFCSTTYNLELNYPTRLAIAEKANYLLESEIATSKISDLEAKLEKAKLVIESLAKYKIYEDYNFKSDQLNNYFVNPVIFPLKTFESDVKLARQTLKELEE
jgi:hypothetical protein